MPQGKIPQKVFVPKLKRTEPENNAWKRTYEDRVTYEIYDQFHLGYRKW